MLRRYDSGQLGKAQPLAGGGARIPASVMRTGVQVYRRADGSEVREYRPEAVVFAPETLALLAGAPVTVGHVDRVDAENWRNAAVGQVSDRDPVKVPRGGEHWADTALLIGAGPALKRIDQADLTEVSMGYDVEVDDRPGVAPNGERYDRSVTKIVPNHIALLHSGARAGKEARLRLDDSQEVIAMADPVTPQTKSTDPVTESILARLDSLEKRAVAAETRADAAEKALKERETALGQAQARADTAEKTLAETRNGLGAAVQARIALVTKLAPVLGPEYKHEGKQDFELRLDALEKLVPEAGKTARAEKWSDERVGAYLDGRLAGTKSTDFNQATPPAGGAEPRKDSVDPLQAKRDAALKASYDLYGRR